MSEMNLIMEKWRHSIVEASSRERRERLADVLSRLKSIQGAQVTAEDLKFLVGVMARDIASGGAFSKELEAAASESGIEITADVVGLGLLKNSAKLVGAVAKRAKVSLKDDAAVLASIMLVDDNATHQNPILDLMNVHDAYEGTINPLLNGPFVAFAMEQLNGASGVLPNDWGTQVMKDFLADERSLETRPTR